MKNIDSKRMFLDNKESVKDFLSFSGDKQLNFLSFWVNSKNRKIYTKKKILKRDWSYRELLIPKDRLKIAQKHILKHVLWFWTKKEVLDNVCWFMPWKSIYNNALFHVWKKILIKIDIKNFFPSISQDRVYLMFKRVFNYNHEVSSYLSWLCTYKNQLPQGAPTSPAISNIVASSLDKRIINYIWKIDSRISYSRYADDLTIWLNDLSNVKVNYLIQKFFSIIEEEWFAVNYNKVKQINSWNCMRITWLTINSDKVSIWRKKYKYVRALIFNIKHNGRIKEKNRYIKKNSIGNISIEKFKNIVNGHINYINMINPILGKKLKEDLSNK